ncbi:MAG TPA: type II and III secretion system protein family protein, partial [Vicinamibacterales bacterium]|nr:type II and III secretion system protein family protein [Vicinamibacterales bacterium]
MVTRRITIALVAALASPAANLSVARLAAQAHPPMPAPSATATAEAPASGSMPTITVMVVAGGSTVVKTDFPITRFALNNPAVADATVVDPTQLLVDGKSAGNVSLIVWGNGHKLSQYDIVVYPPTPALQRQFKALFPGEDIDVSVADEAIVLSGKVSSNGVALRAMEIAEKSSSKSKVINLLQLPGGGEQQVMLQVRVAEVSRRALTQLGVSLFTGANGYKDWVGRSSTQQFPAPTFNDTKLTFTDFLNLFVFNTKYDVGAVVTALQNRGFFQSLAEPTLIAYNGQEASFLAGGEIPVPIAQGGVNAGAITVSYKEFGVRLTFRPTIAGDVIRLKVKPEVSQLDFANGITLQGFRVPALSTRRAETDVELRDGQSFAIGGLMNNSTQTDKAGIPGLSEVPIIGNLFKSKADRKEQTELVVLITPRLVRPMNAGETPALPTVPERFLRPEEKRQIDGTRGPDKAPAGDAAALPSEQTAAP